MIHIPQNNELLYHELHQTSRENRPWVLFIHGAGGSTRTWRKQIDSFKEEYNLLLIDLPGHAQSKQVSIDSSAYTFEWIGNKIWEVVDHLKLSSLHIVAVSLGSIIGMQMQKLRPTAVKSMIFAGPIVGLNFKLRLLARSGLMLAKVIGYHRFYALTARIALPRKNHQKSRQVFVEESRRIDTVEYRKWTAMYGKTLDGSLKNLFGTPPTIPLFFVVGEQDHLFMRPALKYYKKFKKVQLKMIEKCGHVVSIEKFSEFNNVAIKSLNSFIEKAI